MTLSDLSYMNIADFDFHLPQSLIAQTPNPEREHSRLMIVHKNRREIEHRRFYDICDYLKPGDVILINDTRVIPARLYGKKQTGGKVEVLLIERREGKEEIWECFVRASKKTTAGQIIRFGDAMTGTILEECGKDRAMMIFDGDIPFDVALETLGVVPLPPYIKRKDATDFKNHSDRERYQTVFARNKGAVAAPTAGLHFSGELLDTIRNRGVHVVSITLHVGPGTFLPVRVDDIREHRMLHERYEISEPAASAINRAKREGRKVMAVGTTTVRATEASSILPDKHMASQSGDVIAAGRGRTDIFIYPPYRFHIADAMITNFHLPRSTLLMLVSAFAGREKILNAYDEAVEQGYRFYSYGDAMLLI